MAKRKKVLMALDWYDHKLHAGIAEYARSQDWMLNTHMARTRQIPEGWEGDAVLGLIDQAATANFVKGLGLPVVDMGGHYPNFPQILADNHKVGVTGAEYLLEKNHRNFIFLHIQNSRLEHETSAGFALAIEAAGGTCQMHHWKKSKTEQAIHYSAVQAWSVELLKDKPKPVAVMCQNDDTAAIILNACYDAGLRIPEEVAILGAGDNELVCEFLPKTLSSIDPDLRRLGFEAARELGRILRGGHPRRAALRVPPKQVVTRETTDFLAISNPHVFTIVRYIWDHYATPLTVGKLASLVPISRAGLYNLFLKEVGRPIAQELIRVRVENAKHLLKTTDFNITEVGQRCGFSSLINFSRSFSQKVGMSPRDFRLQMRGGEEQLGK